MSFKKHLYGIMAHCEFWWNHSDRHCLLCTGQTGTPSSNCENHTRDWCLWVISSKAGQWLWTIRRVGQGLVSCRDLGFSLSFLHKSFLHQVLRSYFKLKGIGMIFTWFFCPRVLDFMIPFWFGLPLSGFHIESLWPQRHMEIGLLFISSWRISKPKKGSSGRVA